MALRGKKPTTIEKRLKALFYGDPGAGKTTASIQFPRPYLIDTEKGAIHSQYTKTLEKNGGVIFESTDCNEIMEEVRALITEDHEYKTLIIDPITPIYNNLLDEAEKRVGNEFGRHYGEANKKMKQLINLLMSLDMNVIITAHSKNEYGDAMKIVDTVPDTYKKLPYIFDLVLLIKRVGKKRIAHVKKSRIDTFKETFEFSYNAIADAYGREILEKDAVPMDLASEDQVNELNDLVRACGIIKMTSNKWLDKCNARSFSEMPSESIDKCITYLQTKMDNGLKDGSIECLTH